MTHPLLHHRVDGPADAPPLLLGPSLGTSLSVWEGQVPALAREFRVVRWDLPGHGGSDAQLLGAGASVADLGRLVLGLADALGIDRFAYAGVSLGGAVGSWLAVHHPERVERLALVCTAARFGTAEAWQQRAALVRREGMEPLVATAPARWFTPGFAGAAAAELAEAQRTVDPAAYAACCDALAAFDLRDDLGKITAPTLVIAGRADTATPPADARLLADTIPDAGLVELPHAAHLAGVERPDAVLAALQGHLTESACTGTGTVGGCVQGDGSAVRHEPDVRVSGRSGGPGVGGPSGAPPGAAPCDDPAARRARDVRATGTVGGPGEDGPSGALPGAAPHGDRTARRAHADGTAVRRAVLGDAHVDRAVARTSPLTARFQDFITRYAWGEIWTGDTLDRRTRSCITLTALVAGGHHDELALHVRAAVRNGLSHDEIGEVLLQSAVYCGVPAANSAFGIAQRVLDEEATAEAISETDN
ncbi:3-oxoadipate enol-lactonase [Streptomyces sp. NPDC087440]|uniref:bifunctional 3-oxoadipate enol-lactonase/4-carboxymuconolactone decarboxylase PcaDC n=1 Tax=Streptomyces sp. NPDC087440 TaxID=3365790 RepID=UPI0037F6DC1B